MRNRLKHGSAVFVLCCICAAPGRAASFDWPAVVEPASQEHHIGKVIFAELLTPDLAASERFYAAMFGWSFRDSKAAGLDYAQAYLDGRPVAGMLHRPLPTDPPRQPAWLTYLAAPDVDAVEKTARQQGARILFGPRTLPDRGREAVLADPQGAVFAILSSSGGDPPDTLAEPGEWIWSSLITRDPDTDAAFYQALFDYEVFELPSSDGAQHLLLSSDNYARASANSFPADTPGGHPHWLNFIRVDDTVTMTAKAVDLGGRVLVEPRLDRHGGKVAVVADPLGAPFGVLEWPGAESKEVPP